MPASETLASVIPKVHLDLWVDEARSCRHHRLEMKESVNQCSVKEGEPRSSWLDAKEIFKKSIKKNY